MGVACGGVVELGLLEVGRRELGDGHCGRALVAHLVAHDLQHGFDEHGVLHRDARLLEAPHAGTPARVSEPRGERSK